MLGSFPRNQLEQTPEICLMLSLPAGCLSGGCGSAPALRLIRSFATKHPLAPSGLTCRPRLLPLPASEQSVAETLHAMEVKWVASMRASSRGTARLSSEMSDSLPAWTTPSQTSRVHWSDRQQQRQEQHQQRLRRTVRQLKGSSSHGQHSGRQPLHANHISNGNYGSP